MYAYVSILYTQLYIVGCQIMNSVSLRQGLVFGAQANTFFLLSHKNGKKVASEGANRGGNCEPRRGLKD